jgi:hypothetical protein
MPRAREFALWTEDWIELKMRLEQIEAFLRRQPAIVLRGSEFARWDLEVRGGMFGAARLIMAVEDSGAGAQYVRYRVWPRLRRAGLVAVVTSGLLFVATVLNGGWTAILISGLAFALFAVWTVFQAGAGMAAFARATEGFETRKA